MSASQPLDSFDLAALLCSRVCHDVISPVGAIVNGLEVLADEKDEAMKESALDLIRRSAAQASARLQFARLAFGAAGSAGSQIDLGDAEAVVRGLLSDERLELFWNLPRLLQPKDRVKLLLNLVVLGAGAIPRGGKLSVDAVGEGERMGFRLTADGPNAKLPQAIQAALAATSGAGIDAHAIQPYYAALLARAAGLTIAVANAGDRVTLTASQA
jgi:histidine phosphotransferase ChpT